MIRIERFAGARMNSRARSAKARREDVAEIGKLDRHRAGVLLPAGVAVSVGGDRQHAAPCEKELANGVRACLGSG